ncbi:transketolase family protein [Plantactinospora sonchi]|uniref:Transketolase n=1 Tax=Plantactinospora sonchi TaxID=1544735 RepID=A0ABU7RQA1_9ACTN
MRDAFVQTTVDLLENDPRTALVLADISADRFVDAARRHPDRVLNVGIREQLMVGVAGGLALTGMRPIVHSYATFAVDRTYEQLKLDLDHQGVGAIVVTVGASYDGAEMGRTHLSPADVALIDTLTGWTVHVPGHPAEVPALLRAAAQHDGPVYLRLSTQVNDLPRPDAGQLAVVHRGSPVAPVVVAVGPMLHPVLQAVTGLDVTVTYTHTPRPFDVGGLRELLPAPDGAVAPAVVLVEPYLAGTSSAVLSEGLSDVPHRLLALGVGRADLHRYGSPADHARWHGLDPAGLRRSVSAFLG